jgi:hypothetical protein
VAVKDQDISGRAAALAELRRRRDQRASEAPEDYKAWLDAHFPGYVKTEQFAPHHDEYWQWLWDVKPNVRPRPFIGIWARGGGKSTSAETGTVALGVRDIRKYAVYVRSTQEQADNSVTNIGHLLESPAIARNYPAHARRKVSKYGRSTGWRRNRLRTAGGFTVDAFGLDTAMRGAKVEEQRPDLIIFDDIDAKHDSEKMVQKKIDIITSSLLPSGISSTAVMGIQNLITSHGIFAKMAFNKADFLSDRITSGPIPAVVGLQTDAYFDEQIGRIQHRITAGVPTWDGQDLDACEEFIKTFGLSAFIRECQHAVRERERALWRLHMIRHIEYPPRLKRIVVGVDPSGGGDEIGIVAVGQGLDDRGYVLADNTQPGRLGSLNWGREAVNTYDLLQADKIAAEGNFGGDMVKSNIQVSAPNRKVPVKIVRASRGKDIRAEPVASLYSDFLMEHVGAFPELEEEMVTWQPGDDWSPNRLDALVWAATECLLKSNWQDKALVGSY